MREAIERTPVTLSPAGRSHGRACPGDVDQEGTAPIIEMTGQAQPDQTAKSFARLLWGAHNPLIRRYFLGVFRFAQMALADAGNPTHATI
jgi:hypothetical protein